MRVEQFDNITMENKTVKCAICEDVINERDSRYELPDGDVVCTARDCIYDWVRQYKKSGHFIEPYLWVEDEYYEN